MTAVEHEDGVTILRAEGEIDLVNAHELAAALADAAAFGGALTVDLTGVPFMDSTGLRALIETRERLAAAGRPPLLVRVQEGGSVARLLELVGLRDLLGG